jgi:membrane protein YqaA with SNARE-associated domain
MPVLRAVFIALITAFVGGVLAFLVGDYLTKLAQVPEMEGQRGMTVFFLCVPVGIFAGLVIGTVSAIAVRRQGFTAFFIAQGWSLLVVCGLATLLGGVPYFLSGNLRRSTVSTSSCNSSFARQQCLKFQTSPTVTVSASAFTPTIGKISTLSLIGTR